MNTEELNMKKTFLEAESKENRDRVSQDPYRLKYHLMPPVGWLNDPNGLSEFKGTYHIFYQYCPMEPSGAGKKGWGHYSTPDFIHFKEEEITLVPEEGIDEGGSYSGSAFEKGGVLHFFYTGNGKMEGDYDYINEGRKHWTVHFESEDGRNFSEKEVLLKNSDYPEYLSCHVRDPKIIEDNGKYYMVLGSRTRNSEGEVTVFESDDLKNWKKASSILPQVPFGYMWECPDVFDLEGERILITCPQGVDQEGIHFENIYQNGYFLLEKPFDEDQRVKDFTELDTGFDFYAPQTFEDENGRRILIGWMGIPDADYSNPTVERGWQHALTLPRELHIRDGHIYSYPIEETLKLREEPSYDGKVRMSEEIDLPSSACEIQLKTDGQPFRITLRKGVLLTYDGHIFSMDLNGFGSGRTSRSVEISDLNELSIFSDTSSLEIFLNHGQEVMSTRVYDDQKDLKLSADIPLNAVIYPLSGYQIEPKQL